MELRIVVLKEFLDEIGPAGGVGPTGDAARASAGRLNGEDELWRMR